MSSRKHSRTPLSLPRARTPDDEVLAAALVKIRAADPDWEIATAVADQLELLGGRTGDLEAQANARAGLEERVEVLEADHAAREAVVKRAKHWAWGSAGTALVALGTALWFAIGVVHDDGERTGEARAERVRQLEDRAEIRRLRDDHQALEREHAELLGRVRGQTPFRALPVLGPRPDPDPQE